MIIPEELKKKTLLTEREMGIFETALRKYKKGDKIKGSYFDNTIGRKKTFYSMSVLQKEGLLTPVAQFHCPRCLHWMPTMYTQLSSVPNRVKCTHCGKELDFWTDLKIFFEVVH